MWEGSVPEGTAPIPIISNVTTSGRNRGEARHTPTTRERAHDGENRQVLLGQVNRHSRQARYPIQARHVSTDKDQAPAGQVQRLDAARDLSHFSFFAVRVVTFPRAMGGLNWRFA